MRRRVASASRACFSDAGVVAEIVEHERHVDRLNHDVGMIVAERLASQFERLAQHRRGVGQVALVAQDQPEIVHR